MIHAVLDFLHTLTDPERLRQLVCIILEGWLGYALLFGIVFSETGLLVGFFLPGDSLLFTVGVVAGMKCLNVMVIVPLLMAAAIIGDNVGMLKLLFHQDTRQLLGVHVIGESASELVHIGQAVLAFGGGVDYFINTVFNYPTLAEAYKVAAFNALNRLSDE